MLAIMSQAKMGDTVKVQYTGTLDDGTIFDSSDSAEPLVFKIGEETLIPGFEQAVIGMTPGEVKKQLIPCDQAYGPYLNDMVLSVARAMLPEDLQPEIGEQLNIEEADGSVFPVVVIEVSDAKVKLDANHPLAGKDLTFEIQLLEIA
jgi:peptidylprolyl isomerase